MLSLPYFKILNGPVHLIRLTYWLIGTGYKRKDRFVCGAYMQQVNRKINMRVALNDTVLLHEQCHFCLRLLYRQNRKRNM
jgi:hypothetical protein